MRGGKRSWAAVSFSNVEFIWGCRVAVSSSKEELLTAEVFVQPFSSRSSDLHAFHIIQIRIDYINRLITRFVLNAYLGSNNGVVG